MPILLRSQRKPSVGVRSRSYACATWTAGILFAASGLAADQDPALAFKLLARSPGPGWTDETDPAARVSRPQEIVGDRSASADGADNATSVIRHITPEGISTTIARTVETEDVGPGVSSIADQILAASEAVLEVPLSIFSGGGTVEDCDLAAECSDPTLVPAGNFSIHGNGAQRTLLITPAMGRSGTATITVKVSEGGSSYQTSFQLTIEPGERQPNILWGAGNVHAPHIVNTPQRMAADVVAVESGGAHTIFIRANGDLWEIPGLDADAGRPGAVYSYDTTTLGPRKISSGVISASVMGSKVLFVTADHFLQAWGDGAAELFGGKSFGGIMQIATGVSAVSVNWQHAVYLKTDGTLWAAGANGQGQLGDGTNINRFSAVQVATDVAAASAGGAHTMFLKKDGSLWAVGQNSSGQLGDGTTADRSTPVQVATGVASVSAGGNFTFFVKLDGSLWAMGANDAGQLGDGTSANRNTPVQIATDVILLRSGGGDAVFVKKDGSLWMTGKNTAASLDAPRPRQIAAQAALAAVGDGFHCYTDGSGILWGAGDDTLDQLGDGYVRPWLEPLASDVVKVAAGTVSVIYLRSDGSVWLRHWVDDAFVATPIATAGGVVELAASPDNKSWFYRTIGGALWAVDSAGACAQIADDVATVRADAGYFVFLKRDGTLWGQSEVNTISFGPAGTLAQIASDVRSVSAGGGHILYVKQDHTLWGMGTRQWGWPKGSTYVSTPIQLATNALQTGAQFWQDVYLRTDGTLLAVGVSWDFLKQEIAHKQAFFTAGFDEIHTTSGDGSVRFYRTSLPTVTISDVLEFQDGAYGTFAMIQRGGAFTKPELTVPTTSLSVEEGEVATIQVGATGSGPMSFRWFKGGEPIHGADGAYPGGASIVFPAVTVADAGTYTVQASNVGGSTLSQEITLTVKARPTISAIANQTTKEDAATATLAFKVADVDTATTLLHVTAASSNTALIPTAGIVLGGSGANRTVKVTPAANKSGTATITLTVSDGALTAKTSFTVTVTAVNDLPAIEKPADVVIARGANRTIAFKVRDLETSASALTVTRASSNTALLPTANLVLGGSGGNRTLKLTPVSTKTGTTTVTLAVADANGGKASTSFKVTVANPPAIAAIANQTTNEDTTTGTIAVKLSDTDTPTAKLTLSAKSSNATLVPANAFAFGGSGANRTLRIKPGADQSGTATITLTVSDGLLTANRSFQLTVKPVNDRPTISAIANQATSRNTETKAIAFKIADAETAATKLKLTKASSNTALLPTANILLGGSGANRTVTLKPAPNKTGTAKVTLTVSDGQLSANRTFTLTVNAPPTISKLANQTIAKNAATSPLKFTIGDAETTPSKLKVTAVSANPKLLAPTGIVLGGSGANRTVKITPVKNLTGSVKVTLTVSDGMASASTAFTVTIASTVKKTDADATARPAVTTPPISQIAKAGSAVTLAVRATGATSYQWTRDDHVLPGATTAGLKLPSVKLTDAGGYAVKLTNAAGTTTSPVAELTVVDVRSAATRSGPVAAVTQTISVAGAADTLALSVLLPDGWRYVSGAVAGAISTPQSGDSALLEWRWPEVPVKPLTFTYVLEVPAAKALPDTFDALVQIRAGGTATKLLFEEALR